MPAVKQKPKRKAEPVVIAPASIPQELFINSEADIVIASGSAGSSKSYGILLRFLRFINDPKTEGVIFRRTSTQLEMPGGLWNESIALYSSVDPGLKVNLSKKQLTFSSGATLKFSHYENEAAKVKLKGMQASFQAIDEATEFTEEMVTYLMSRLRSAGVSYKPSICMATNPMYDSFLRHWVLWWLDPETGIPDRKKMGIIRYFVKQGSEFVWADTRKELEDIYGTGPESGIMSMTVIGSTVYDNPYIMNSDPSYVSRLKSLSPVETARLLYGSWFARQESAGYFKREWCTKIEFAPYATVKRVRAWDMAGTLPSQANPNPDWTVGILMSKTKDGAYIVEDMIRFRGRFHEVEKKIFETAEADGVSTTVVIPKDPGQAGTAYASTLTKALAERGFTSKMMPTNKSKLDRFKPFAAIAEAKIVQVVIADWNKDFFDELEAFNGDGKQKDDICDACSDAWAALRNTFSLPSFSLPDFTRANPFKTNITSWPDAKKYNKAICTESH